MLSIIIPAYNEQSNLEKLIPYLLEHGGKSLDQIIIAQSPQSTDSLISFQSLPKVKVIQGSIGRRSTQLNEGAQAASSPWFYFLHADTTPPPSFIDDIKKAISDGYNCGCFSYKFDSPSKLLAINSYFTRKKGLFTGGGDQGLFISRSQFQTMGGYNNSLALMEDFELYDRLIETGEKFVIIPKDALVSARKYKMNNYLKVNWVQLQVFMAYKLKMPQETWKNIYQRLKT